MDSRVRSSGSIEKRDPHAIETFPRGFEGLTINQVPAIDILMAFPLVRAVGCGAEGIRTPDPLDANEVRYRTALQPRGLVGWRGAPDKAGNQPAPTLAGRLGAAQPGLGAPSVWRTRHGGEITVTSVKGGSSHRQR